MELHLWIHILMPTYIQYRLGRSASYDLVIIRRILFTFAAIVFVILSLGVTFAVSV